MKFRILLNDARHLVAVSLRSETPGKHWVYEADSEGNTSYRQDCNTAETYLARGYHEVTTFGTRASTFEGHLRALDKLNLRMRRYWTTPGPIHEQLHFAVPLEELRTWNCALTIFPEPVVLQQVMVTPQPASRYHF